MMTQAAPRLASRAAEAQLFHSDSDVGVGAVGNVFVVVWRDRTTTEAMTIISPLFASLAASCGPGLGLVTIIEAKAKMPPAQARTAMADWLHGASGTLAVSAVAFEGDGFVAASVRGVIVGMTLVARQTFPHRVFKSVQLATQWMHTEGRRLGSRFDAGELQEGIARIRMQIGNRASGAVRAYRG